MNPFSERNWRVGHGRSLELGPRGRLMAILNVTPDSFSDGGMNVTVSAAVDAAMRLIEDGADIVDVGGESTRPGASPVSVETETERVLPVIEALAARTDTLISIDTSRASVARAACAAGAHIVNDVSGLLGDPDMTATVAAIEAGLVVMHNSRSSFRPEREDDPVADQIAFHEATEERLTTAGISSESVVLDPGLGFGKEAEENVVLIMRLEELTTRSFPVLLGASRKRFIGTATGREADQRDVGTAITTAFARRAGAALFRVHDVVTNIDALRMTEALMAVGEQQ